MPIEFHCPFCGRTIRAADEHAGKHGKCPSCHQSVYVPTPPELIEPLPIAPLDGSFEDEKARMERENRELQRRLLQEREAQPDARGRTPASRPTGASPASESPPPPPVDVETLVIEYAICMADGNLEEAAELATEIRKHMKQADDVMQRLTMDEIPPPQLARIPRPVLVKFFKQLREK
jgi:hypothetical protein